MQVPVDIPEAEHLPGVRAALMQQAQQTLRERRVLFTWQDQRGTVGRRRGKGVWIAPASLEAFTCRM